MSNASAFPLHILRRIPFRNAGPLIAVLLLPWPLAHVFAQNPSDKRPDLVRFLENAPDVSQLYAGPVPVNYVNYRNAQIGCGPGPIENVADLNGLDDEQFKKWTECLGRVQPFIPQEAQSTGPGLLQFQQLAPELTAELLARKVPGVGSVFRDLPKRLGIEWFEIHQALSFGMPPNTAVVLGYEDDVSRSTSINPVLIDAGFGASRVGGFPVWLRFDDLEIRESAVLPPDKLGRVSSDPFGIAHGYGLTLIEKPGVLAGSRRVDVTGALGDTWTGAFPNILQVSAYRAAAEAVSSLDRYDGVLIQSLFLGIRYTPADVSLMRLGPYVSNEQHRAYADELKTRDPPPLGSYRLIVLADRQASDEALVLLALVFDDRSSADYAAQILPELVSAYSPIEYGAPLPELTGFTASAYVFQSQTDAPPVAVLEMRSSGNNARGKLFKIFSSGFRHHDLDILVSLP